MTSRTTDRPLRPRNRREQIAEAAGRAFSQRGYHAVGMDDIASAVGITAAALYRHFPNKYALFVHCAKRLADGLVQTLDTVPAGAGLEQTLSAIARTTVGNRATGGIYRWEARYLEAPERAALRATFRQVTDRVATAVIDARSAAGVGPAPDDATQARFLAATAMGAIGSATAHRTTIAARRLEELLTAAALEIALVPGLPGAGLGAAEATPPSPPATGAFGGDGIRGRRREQILRAAVPLMARDGYVSVSMGVIASAVGLTPSGLYRHFAGKSDILVAAGIEGAEWLQAGVDRELSGCEGPEQCLAGLAEAYVEYSFEHTDLTSVVTAELGGLPSDAQRPLKRTQRDHISLWEEHLRAARPELSPVDARVLVHAGFGAVVEAGRALRWQDTPGNRAVVVALVLAALRAPVSRA